MAETTTPPNEVDTATINKILKQVEYYFSDSNYPRDKFLNVEAAKHPDQYIGIDVIASFKRMKELSEDLQLISDTLKKSDKLVVSEDGKMVKRVYPIPESIGSEKSLYSKGWPLDTTTIEKVEEFFKPYGKVLSVRFRKNRDKTFKGSMVCDFESEEIVNKIVEEAPKLADAELQYMTFNKFSDEKKAEQEKYLSTKKPSKDKKRKTMEEGKENPDNNTDESKEAKVDEKTTTEEKETIVMVPGCIIAFDNMTSQRGELSTFFTQYGEVAFVGYNSAETVGTVRYTNPENAKNALAKLQEEKKEIGGKVPNYRLLDGEDEKKEWDVLIEKEKNRQQSGGKRGGRGGRGGRGRGGRGRGGKKGGK
ncbi:Lupus La protein [Tieghemostelium lacteum]|uniref:Lupus La protein n=1 Tax=Tieghemostelium lacteum TaxID=361077 RepID=A0A152AA29_TIELA|nr:Lupus La protein [Tieghemostelium lacteum]|eukprot:KYR03064.1 Lupus La protein [Tieghemostelium lacteum]